MTVKKLSLNEQLSVFCYIRNVANLVGVKALGHALEQYFEPLPLNTGMHPSLLRTNKYRNYVKGESCPSVSTLTTIESKSRKCAALRGILTLPLWAALGVRSTVITVKKEITEIYYSLNRILQRLLFDDMGGRKYIKLRNLEAIVRQGNSDALACVICLALERKLTDKYVHVDTYNLTDAINRLLITCLLETPLKLIQIELFECIEQLFMDHTFQNAKDKNIVIMKWSAFQKKESRRNLILDLLSKSHLIEYEHDRIEAHYWFALADEKNLLNDFLYLDLHGHIEKSTAYGLVWLIEKLNFKRDASRKLNINSITV